MQRRSAPHSAPDILGLKAEVLRRVRIKVGTGGDTMNDSDTVEVPARLYAQARRRLLENEPLRDHAVAPSVAGSLSAGEASALERVGLSAAPWVGEAHQDPLGVSVTEYM